MNLNEIRIGYRSKLRELVNDNNENTLNIYDRDDLKFRLRRDWAVVDITKDAIYHITMRNFYHIPYGKRDLPKDISEQTHTKFLNGNDFAIDFQELFRDCDSEKFILLHDNRNSIADAIEGLFQLGPRNDFLLATYAEKNIRKFPYSAF